MHYENSKRVSFSETIEEAEKASVITNATSVVPFNPETQRVMVVNKYVFVVQKEDGNFTQSIANYLINIHPELNAGKFTACFIDQVKNDRARSTRFNDKLTKLLLDSLSAAPAYIDVDFEPPKEKYVPRGHKRDKHNQLAAIGVAQRERKLEQGKLSMKIVKKRPGDPLSNREAFFPNFLDKKKF